MSYEHFHCHYRELLGVDAPAWVVEQIADEAFKASREIATLQKERDDLEGWRQAYEVRVNSQTEYIKSLKEGLTSIRDYGFKNTGHGYSCAKMAEKTLEANR